MSFIFGIPCSVPFPLQAGKGKMPHIKWKMFFNKSLAGLPVYGAGSRNTHLTLAENAFHRRQKILQRVWVTRSVGLCGDTLIQFYVWRLVGRNAAARARQIKIWKQLPGKTVTKPTLMIYSNTNKSSGVRLPILTMPHAGHDYAPCRHGKSCWRHNKNNAVF